MVAAFDYCLHGRGWRRALDRHGDARPGRRTARRPPPPRRRDRPRDRRRRRGPDQGVLRRRGAVGAVAAPGVPAGPRHRPRSTATTPRRSVSSSVATASRPGARPARSARRTRWRSSGTAQQFLDARGRAEPFGATVARATTPLPDDVRRAPAQRPWRRSSAAWPPPTSAQVGHFTDTDVVLDFLSRDQHPRLAALGTSCPDHFLRTKVRPMVLDLPPSAPLDETVARLEELHDRPTAPTTPPTTSGTPTRTTPAMRGADPAIVLVPGVGMFSFGRNKQTARVAGEFYVNAINVMRGAEAVSTYAPIDEQEKFRIEYWAAGGGRSSSGCQRRSRWPPGSRSSPAPGPASAGPSPTGSPPRAPAWSSPTATARRPGRSPPRSAARTSPWP